MTEKAYIWQNLTRNLEVKQIDNINIFFERSRSGWIKYVIFDVAGPKYSRPEAKYLSQGGKYLTKMQICGKHLPAIWM